MKASRTSKNEHKTGLVNLYKNNKRLYNRDGTNTIYANEVQQASDVSL